MAMPKYWAHRTEWNDKILKKMVHISINANQMHQVLSLDYRDVYRSSFSASINRNRIVSRKWKTTRIVIYIWFLPYLQHQYHSLIAKYAFFSHHLSHLWFFSHLNYYPNLWALAQSYFYYPKLHNMQKNTRGEKAGQAEKWLCSAGVKRCFCVKNILFFNERKELLCISFSLIIQTFSCW